MVVLARTAAETQKPLIFVYSLQHIRCDLWIADCFTAWSPKRKALDIGVYISL